jgi:hypothetical protein
MRTHAKTMSSPEEPGREEQARRPTPQDWDARVERGLMHAPAWLRGAVEWLRAPSRFWVRLVAGILLILGGILAILPIFGLWMLPLGLALIADDVPWLKARLEQAARWCERMWRKVRRRG